MENYQKDFAAFVIKYPKLGYALIYCLWFTSWTITIEIWSMFYETSLSAFAAKVLISLGVSLAIYCSIKLQVKDDSDI